MPLVNTYNTTLLTLSGLNTTSDSKYLYFTLTFVCYLLIVFVNLTLIVTIFLRENLHEPMYIFLCNLCFNGLYGSAGFYPKFLSDLLSEPHVISFVGCLLQVLVIYSSVLCDFSTLTVMAYDRSVAICKPLEYHSIMTNKTVAKLLAFSWFAPVLLMGLLVILSSWLTLCGSHIEKLYCENWSIVKLSCSPTVVNNVIGYIIILVYLGHVVFILYSYSKLIRTCLMSKESQSKFMQTCVPHVLTLVNVTVALLFDTMYSRYGSSDFPQDLRSFLQLEFLILPPLLNPIIYGLKLNKVRTQVLRRHRNQNRVHF